MCARAAILSTAALGLSTFSATAGVFGVNDPSVNKGETEISVNTSVFSGFPENAQRLRGSLEISLGYGLTDRWFADVRASLDKPLDEAFQLSTVGTEHIFNLKKLEGGYALGWYTAVDVRVASDQTNTFTLGPILQFGREKSFLAFNPFFARTFGVNSTEGIDFNYAWQAKHEVATGVSVGIEGYGVVPNLGNSPGLDFQEHRIGPVLYFEKELSAAATGGPAKLGKAMSMTDAKSPAPADAGAGGNAPKLAVEAGVLFGLTAGTQDVAFKLKGAITY